MITGFSLDIYDCDISFAWDTNEKELRAFLDANDVPEDRRDEFIANTLGAYVGAVTVGMGDSTNCITVFKCEPNNKVVAHEIFHIAHRVLTLRGIEDEEAWAYLIGYLTEMFYDLYLGKIETEDISPTYTAVSDGSSASTVTDGEPHNPSTIE